MAGEHEFCWEEAVRRLGAEEKIPETLADKKEFRTKEISCLE